jgi:hypothetical protein
MTPQEFWDACEAHDWFYDFSDDGEVARRGRAHEEMLQRQAQISGPPCPEMFKQFKEFHFSGESFGKPQIQKPERPT